jgi:hypothetical protein
MMAGLDHRPREGIRIMEALFEAGSRTVTISLNEQELAKLGACAKYRQMSVAEVVQHYLNDWIDTDYPASQGTFNRRQLYRD